MLVVEGHENGDEYVVPVLRDRVSPILGHWAADHDRMSAMILSTLEIWSFSGLDDVALIRLSEASSTPLILFLCSTPNLRIGIHLSVPSASETSFSVMSLVWMMPCSRY